ncbi:phosphocholine-specific phospholipase C [Sphingobacterium faecale]|uniref:phospholipase C n=1 Tax=Sphingobacterium faecale TaxID=2803775 RepID=A0ABS1QZ64_9SPHI|nr:phospholipase C, phosphocholine-specific [Sphingobacterium faecale]MBL1407365.1 phospholipase C, phosphocholine-specific [Sphingobacterium faecale]
MESRREFLRKTLLFSGAAGITGFMPSSIQKAFAIDPEMGSSFLDAEHVVILMQENRSFDHALGTLSGVRGFNDPRSISLPNGLPVWYQTDKDGHTFAPFRLDLKGSKVTWMGSLPHSRASQVDAFNNGKYDKWLIAKRPGNKKYAEMPLTLGYFTREDLPFHYALADAFTVCDQNFCSGMTSTTPNRSFFWTGKISEMKDGMQKVNIRNEDFSYGKHTWKSFPELLESQGITWRFYQNETSCGGGLTGEERSWLANFGCNLLEFFQAYNVKFKDTYIANLEKQARDLPGQITALEERSPGSEEEARRIKEDIRKKSDTLEIAERDLKTFSSKSYEQLSPYFKSLNNRAFTINRGDDNYRSLVKLNVTHKGTLREVEVPKGDVLHQFREDVNMNRLPVVSWLAGPKNFSDHPSAPWYGAWYVSEILDILTNNPEVWKKTIFIITYDENDGYFDHVKPFVIPDLKQADTGKCSVGIDSEVEMVRLENELKQGVPKKQAREGAIGLGFRVPMYIVSPWSRGGKVCSEVFDHTSTLQFLEYFVRNKFNKDVQIDNISDWRRTICGDLTSAFTPFLGKQDKLPFLDRNEYISTIYNAQFKDEPKAFIEIKDLKGTKRSRPDGFLQVQEKGRRIANAIPYDYDVIAYTENKKFVLMAEVSTQIFGVKTVGVPLNVYSPLSYRLEDGSVESFKNWNFAVKAGDKIFYEWELSRFLGTRFHFLVHGPNGFFREFQGDVKDPSIAVGIVPELKSVTRIATGKVNVIIKNLSGTEQRVNLKNVSYQSIQDTRLVKANSEVRIPIDLSGQGNWYDLEVRVAGAENFCTRIAGRVEMGKETSTDPLIG